jgi:phosphatidylserine decarboxylase
LKGRRNPFVAREGFPFLVVTLAGIFVVWQYAGGYYAIPLVILLVYFVLVFRDPRRNVPAVPLGIVSPVDGTVIDVGLTDKSVLNGEAHKIIIRVNSLGTYTARCPIEGKVMDFRGDQPNKQVPGETSGLWVRTDEDDDVVLQFHGHRFGLAPRAFLRYGERVGQGQRCAYLRLTRFAEVQLPINGRVLVAAGQRVAAGSDVLAKLPHA